MKKTLLLLAALKGLSLFAVPNLPLSFDLGVHPEARGTQMNAVLEWRWSERWASSAEVAFSTANESDALPGYGPGALYATSSEDGTLVLKPLVWNNRLGIFDIEAMAGLGLKTENFRERGTYQSVGTQVFDNEVKSWRIGTPIGGAVGTRLGPVAIGWDIAIWPASLYVLAQAQTSSLIAPAGSLKSLCLVGPEIGQDLRVSAFTWFWLSAHHEFLWLSVPRLAQNAAGDAWTTVIEGKTNQVLRLLGGLRVPIPMGSLDAGLGWRRVSSASDGGGTAEIDQGLIFELTLSAGR